ncbi:MAG TPA: hypothetical protein VLG92_03500 [Candidatus Saccharimonadia bacterium]|nr:hypothetical protein [Candidatus Saccharimonadia bacterium]
MAEGDMDELLRKLLAAGDTPENREMIGAFYYDQFHRRLGDQELGKLAIRALGEPNWPY